ncbi:MAG: formate dehydrogenase accessory protein FdhE [Deltaproteobacteria bacterium]|nr:formate dehydrogenase accessory protein FdhE [Deltaproteobacteria bacterium]MBW2119054.1 formate dehydrogenase accessory protein FdhE [Deltaproteobacteria bacterium]MBW2342398.1 formate dehydrogenase accessory protein FdhE [Deltaproteobacteria bacterium]
MIEHLLENIDRLIQQRPVCKEALESYRELAGLMKEVQPEPQDIRFEERLKDMKKNEGFPLFSREDLPVDLHASSKLFAKFMEHLSNTERKDKDGLKKVLEKSKNDLGWIDSLLKAVLGKDDKVLSKAGKELDLDPATLSFLAQEALRPSLYALRDATYDKIDTDNWNYGYCPVCGSEPDMAYFTKTGKRYLHCELCSQEWAYPRIKCPFCQNEEHKTLGYFDVEGEEGFRVDFCRKCQRYLKTLDKRVFEEAAPMELENLATIHLDILANDHGFK